MLTAADHKVIKSAPANVRAFLLAIDAALATRAAALATRAAAPLTLAADRIAKSVRTINNSVLTDDDNEWLGSDAGLDLTADVVEFEERFGF